MDGVPLETRVALLRAYGTFPQAYSATYQPNLLHFGDQRGFIAYKKIGRTAFVLADPVAPPDHHADLIGRFLKQYPIADFWQVSRPTVEILLPQGFLINELGPDPRLDLATYSFSGKDKQNLRTAINRAAKSGYVIRECSLTSLDIDEVRKMSEAWRATRTIRSREVSFINRPFEAKDEVDVRKFFLFDRDGRLQALGGFDPIYEGGEIVGYIAQHNRNRPEVASFADHAIKRHAIETFQREGRKWFYLGLAPFAHLLNQQYKSSRSQLVHRIFVFSYKNDLVNRLIYPLKGHELHKRQFRGAVEQTYCAFSRRPTIPRLFMTLRACNII
ncbi:MAG: DUF2156 domain-containing protein [Rhizobiales bacterium]|nr:DUF2156 domain-containing protein [Hyphomicrobiales bacterium]